jgi:hypothetical protein
MHTFGAGVTLITPGDQTLTATATDTANGTITGSATVTVAPGPTPAPGGNANGPRNPPVITDSTPVPSRQQVVLLDRLFASAHEKETWLTLARLKRNVSWDGLFNGIGEVVV